MHKKRPLDLRFVFEMDTRRLFKFRYQGTGRRIKLGVAAGQIDLDTAAQKVQGQIDLFALNQLRKIFGHRRKFPRIDQILKAHVAQV